MEFGWQDPETGVTRLPRSLAHEILVKKKTKKTSLTLGLEALER